MKKKVLITTIPIEHISSTVRLAKRGVTTSTPEECMDAANNLEFINGFIMPNYGTQFIKANVPSIDILEYPTWNEYKDALKNNYDVVGISFWTYTAYEAVEMARIAREAGVKEIWGGGHGISTPGIARHFDRIFSSYSEYELKPLVEEEELTEFRHPVMKSKYDFHLNSFNTGFLFTIRGCRFPCSYCSGPRYYKKLAPTPIEEVERILDVYKDMGVNHISVVDETFLQNKSHSRQVLKALLKRELTWNCTSRIDILLGNIKELKQYGLNGVYTGIESMNDLSLEAAKKGETSLQITALLKELEQNQTYVIGTYMICFDFDSEQSIKEDIEKINMFKSLYGVVFWIATPFPGTDDYDNYEKAGLIADRNWKNYDVLHLVKKHPTISPQKARELLAYCIKNHCNELNIRKAKILRKWERLEKQRRVRLKTITA